MTATEQAESLDVAMDQNTRMMRRCPEGCVPSMAYEPGAMFGGCVHRQITLPDWQPVELRKLWNGEKL